MQLQNVQFAILSALFFRSLPELLESLSVYSGDTIREVYMRCAQEGPNYSLSIPTLIPMPHLTVLDLQGDAFHMVRSHWWSLEGATVEEICRNAENLQVEAGLSQPVERGTRLHAPSFHAALLVSDVGGGADLQK